jgi:hypothetical protein
LRPDLGVGAPLDATGVALADGEAPAPDAPANFDGDWAAVRDANIRPYVEWRASVAVALPVAGGNHGGAGARPPHAPQHGHPSHSSGSNRGPKGGGDGGLNGGGGRRRRRRRPGGGGGPSSGGGGGRNQRFGREGGDRNRERGPRLPGFYNPGGD